VFAQVGGIKSKVLAAHRAGIRRIILPKRNEKDLKEIPATIQVFIDNKTDLNQTKRVFDLMIGMKAEMYFNFVTHIDQVIEAAFDGNFTRLSSSHKKIGQLESKL